jgi:large subunit ribosomal protein L33
MAKPRTVALVCSECEARNYHKKPSRQPGTRFEVKKFCPKCNKHTVHKESK